MKRIMQSKTEENIHPSVLQGLWHSLAMWNTLNCCNKASWIWFYHYDIPLSMWNNIGQSLNIGGIKILRLQDSDATKISS